MTLSHKLCKSENRGITSIFLILKTYAQYYESRRLHIRRLLKQFKTVKELNDFLALIQKRGIEKMLEGELDGHLGYNKHEQTGNDNARNGYGKKKIKTQYGESEIKVPRDRDANFNPMIVPKRESMVEGLEEVIVSLYAKGMSVSDIEEQVREVYSLTFPEPLSAVLQQK